MRLAAWAVAASVFAGVATLTGQAPVEPSPGTREMAALLAARAAAVAPGDLWFNVNDRRAEAIAGAIAGSAGAPNLFAARSTLAKELLFAGRYADSVALVDDLLKEVTSLGAAPGASSPKSTC